MINSENIPPLYKTTKTIEPNGNVYFVGDIHGHIASFWQGLEELNFNPDKDIIIALGDLVDRGPESLECLRLLNNPWFYSVVGNHECKLYSALLNSSHKPGMDDRWLGNTSSEEKREMLELLKSLYWTIDIQIDDLQIGVVHADIPPNTSWSDFVKKIKQQDLKNLAYATFSRKILDEENFIVPDLDYLIIGHQGLDDVTQWGNVLCIDTSVFVPKGFGNNNGLTFALKNSRLLKTITI